MSVEKISATKARNVIFIMSAVPGILLFLIIAIFIDVFFGIIAGGVLGVILFTFFMKLLSENIDPNL